MTAEQVWQQLHEWNAYYEIAGAAAATLLGLLFVSVSLNADLILAGERPQTKQLAQQAFQNYIAVLAVSLLFVCPRLDVETLGASLIMQATVLIVWVAFRLKKTLGMSDASFGRTHMWRRLMPSLLSYGLLILAGGKLTRNFETSAFRLVAFSTIVLLISATVTSWDLLVRVAEIRHTNVKY